MTPKEWKERKEQEEMEDDGDLFSYLPVICLVAISILWLCINGW